MAITAADVKALREATGAGMMECKKALTECNGDMDAAIDYLREKGISKEVIISSLCDAMVAAYKKHLRVKELENVEAYLEARFGAKWMELPDKKTRDSYPVHGNFVDLYNDYTKYMNTDRTEWVI